MHELCGNGTYLSSGSVSPRELSAQLSRRLPRGVRLAKLRLRIRRSHTAPQAHSLRLRLACLCGGQLLAHLSDVSLGRCLVRRQLRTQFRNFARCVRARSGDGTRLDGGGLRGGQVLAKFRADLLLGLERGSDL